MLDPACGSMHFGLYAFDLFIDIYREVGMGGARAGLNGTPFARLIKFGGRGAGGEGSKPLRETYADKGELLRDVPRLIIERNIHGIDIDPRAVQIAGLSLWLRAQRTWHDAGVKAKDRPLIGRELMS